MTRRRSILNRLPAPRLAWLIMPACLIVLVFEIIGIVHLLADLDPLTLFLVFEWVALLVLSSAVGIVVGLAVQHHTGNAADHACRCPIRED